MYICGVMMDQDNILRAIADVYETDCMTADELLQVLGNCGYSNTECREIIRQAINEKEIGRVSYRRMGKKFPARNTMLCLKKKKKNF